MTYEQIINKMNNETFNCLAFGGQVTVRDFSVYCDDGRIVAIASKSDVSELYESFLKQTKG